MAFWQKPTITMVHFLKCCCWVCVYLGRVDGRRHDLQEWTGWGIVPRACSAPSGGFCGAPVHWPPAFHWWKVPLGWYCWGCRSGFLPHCSGSHRCCSGCWCCYTDCCCCWPRSGNCGWRSGRCKPVRTGWEVNKEGEGFPELLASPFGSYRLPRELANLVLEDGKHTWRVEDREDTHSYPYLHRRIWR